jgi:hypothetical protein
VHPTTLWGTPSSVGRRTKDPILVDGEVGVIVHVHLKNNHDNITNPNIVTLEK